MVLAHSNAISMHVVPSGHMILTLIQINVLVFLLVACLDYLLYFEDRTHDLPYSNKSMFKETNYVEHINILYTLMYWLFVHVICNFKFWNHLSRCGVFLLVFFIFEKELQLSATIVITISTLQLIDCICFNFSFIHWYMFPMTWYSLRLFS